MNILKSSTNYTLHGTFDDNLTVDGNISVSETSISINFRVITADSAEVGNYYWAKETNANANYSFNSEIITEEQFVKVCISAVNEALAYLLDK